MNLHFKQPFNCTLFVFFLLFSPIAHADITTGLVGYWPFEEGSGTTAYDSSGNSNNGTLTNSPAWVMGGVGLDALNFNGSSQDVNVSNASSLNVGTGSFTVSAWVKPNSGLNNYYQVVGKKLVYNGSNIGWDFWLDYRNVGVLELRLNDGTISNDLVSQPSANLQTILNGSSWVHVAIVVNLGNNVIFYVNGQSYGSFTISSISGSVSNTQALTIGGKTGYYFPGSIQDVRVYNRALTAGDVQQLYNYRYDIPTVGLVGYWTFDEGSGTTAHDSSGSGNTGTLVNSPTWTTGKIGNALSFNGTTNYVNANITLVAGSAYTIAFWAKNNNPQSSSYANMLSNNSGGNTLILGSHPPSSLFYANGTYFSNNYTSLIASTSWHHYCYIFTGSNLNLYIDGVYQETATYASPGATAIDIGDVWSNHGAYNYRGNIDDVRIYNRALSSFEVSALYKNGNGPSAAGVSTAQGAASITF